MAIKKFKAFLEQNIAADYVAPKDDDDEVKKLKPRSKGEQKFKDMHKVEITPYPVAHKGQHTAEETDLEEGGKGSGRPRKNPVKTADEREADDTTKRYMVKMSDDGKTKVAEYEGTSELDARSKAQVDAKRMGIRIDSVRLKEDLDLGEEVLSDLKKIVEKNQSMDIKFSNGKIEKVDTQSANAILKLHNSVNEENKKKIGRMVNSSPAQLMKVLDVAMKGDK